MHRWLLALLVAASLGGLAAGSFVARGQTPPAQHAEFRYEDIPPGYGFPTEENVLLGYLYRDDQASLRQRSWTLWAGLTAPSRSVWNEQVLPIWQTWYGETELFELPYRGSFPLGANRRFTFEVAPPRQIGHHPAAPGAASAAVLGFVKYNEPGARFLWDNGYYLRDTLEALGARFDRDNTPVEQRRIAPFPRAAVALKPVFWLIKDPTSAQAPDGLTPLPYSDPDYPPPADGRTPMHLTWTKCVAVDPTGTYPPGSVARVNCNGTADAPRWVEATVIPLDRFYTYRLSDQTEIDAARRYAAQLSTADEQERFITDPGMTPEIGDWLALMAMHVTTKEIADWTWQTFWWSPTPNTAPHGHDRSPLVQGVWANYQMCTVLSMVTPRTADGGPHVCFNPYLESDLGPTKPLELDGRTYPPDPMAGTRSNCMSCHVRAGWPASSSNYGRVFNEGYLAPNDPYFARLVQTDFLWSIIFNAQPKQASPN